MNIDLNTLRSLATVVCFVAFIGVVVWAYSKRNRAAFDEAAQLPFESE
jgi:cytochrome c oxidase cbb3-type subunit IV